ncbi:uncharacterized protein [Linepithema humile]|uniref:uncharacterized protein isoform X2 n=1 Tax=Linepithema humile TaxID=83485 RepID=UPI00351E5022
MKRYNIIRRPEIREHENGQSRGVIFEAGDAEMNRENTAMKFQQQILPLKSEANSMSATPSQDQLRSVNPIPDTIKPTFRRQNSNDSIGSLADKKSCGSCVNEEKRTKRMPSIEEHTIHPPPEDDMIEMSMMIMASKYQSAIMAVLILTIFVY